MQDPPRRWRRIACRSLNTNQPIRPQTNSRRGPCQGQNVHIIESDLIRMRTREGMKVAKAKGRLRGKQPKLKPAQEAHLVELWHAGKHTSAELADLFSVARSTVYRAVQRAGEPESVRTRGA